MDLKVMYIATLSILALTGNIQTQCIADSHVNGCSIPLGLRFYYQREFTLSCHKHDVCYFCVSTTVYFIDDHRSSTLNRILCT